MKQFFGVLSIFLVVSIFFSGCAVKSVLMTSERSSVTTLETVVETEVSIDPNIAEEKVEETVESFMSLLSSGSIIDNGFRTDLCLDPSLSGLTDLHELVLYDLNLYLSDFSCSIVSAQIDTSSGQATCLVEIDYWDPVAFLRSEESQVFSEITIGLEYEEASDSYIITDISEFYTLVFEPLTEVNFVVYSASNVLRSLLEDYYIPEHLDFHCYYKMIYFADYYDQLVELQKETGVTPDLYDIYCDEGLSQFVESDMPMGIEELGITEAEISAQFPCSLVLSTDREGSVNALAYLISPGVVFYNTDVAEEYFGTSDREEIQSLFSTWDNVMATSTELAEASSGETSLASTLADLWRSYDFSRTTSWRDQGRLVIDDEMNAFFDLAAVLIKAGQIAEYEPYSAEWYSGMSDQSIFTYWGPDWFYNYHLTDTMYSDPADWEFVAPPTPYLWNNAYLAAGRSCRDKDRAADIIRFITLNESAPDEMIERIGFYNHREAMTGWTAKQPEKIKSLYELQIEQAEVMAVPNTDVYDFELGRVFLDTAQAFAKGSFEDKAAAAEHFLSRDGGQDQQPVFQYMPTPIPTPVPLTPGGGDPYVLAQDIVVKDFDGKSYVLYAGQIICVYSDDWYDIDLESRFADLSGNEFYVDLAYGKYGTLYINATADFDLLLSDEMLRSHNKNLISAVPWTQLHGISGDDQYVFNIDWDRDGVIDELILERDEYDSSEMTFTFKSGANNDAFREEISLYNDASNDVFASICFETLLLYAKTDGEYVLLITEELDQHLYSCEPSGSLFITYDEEAGYRTDVTQRVYEYRDNLFYMSDYNRIFGDAWSAKTVIQLNDDFSATPTTNILYFTTGWMRFSYPLADLQVELQNLERYEPYTLAKGIAFYPIRSEISADGKGYLYAKTFDGKTFRIPYKWNKDSGDYFVTIYDRPTPEVIYVVIGG